MKTIEYRTIDKSTWPHGPRDKEARMSNPYQSPQSDCSGSATFTNAAKLCTPVLVLTGYCLGLPWGGVRVSIVIEGIPCGLAGAFVRLLGGF